MKSKRTPKLKAPRRVVLYSIIRRIVNLEAQKDRIEKAVNKQYAALAKQVIPDCERAIGRPLRTPGDLMDWIGKNRPELKALDTTHGDNWEYWPANRMLFGAYA